MLTKVINLKVYILLIILFFLVSCEESKNQVSQLYDDSFNDDETKEISCPEVKFIEGLDRLKIKNGGKNVYQLSFYEIKWTCYTSLSLINTIMDNIDLSTSFVVDYNENINNFKEEQFSFIVVLLNEENQIITKEKFNRTKIIKYRNR